MVFGDAGRGPVQSNSFGMVQVGISYANIRQPHILKCQFDMDVSNGWGIKIWRELS
jgi:hypothetical protein